MDLEQAVKSHMRHLGCKDERQIVQCYHLYTHLLENTLMHNVQLEFNRELNIMYVIARPSKNDRMNTYIPISTSAELNMNKIWQILETVKHNVNFAFIESDTTVVIYKFHDGFLGLTDSSMVLRKRKSAMDAEVRKRTSELIDKAVVE